MQFTVLPKQSVAALVTAAQIIQQHMDDGIIGNAFCGDNTDHVQEAVTAFDRLNKAATELAAETKIASPFLRYRREIMASTPAGMALRLMVMSMYGSQPVEIRAFFEHFGDHEIRVALECLTSFAANGDRDSQFMSLGLELSQDDCQHGEAA